MRDKKNEHTLTSTFFLLLVSFLTWNRGLSSVMLIISFYSEQFNFSNQLTSVPEADSTTAIGEVQGSSLTSSKTFSSSVGVLPPSVITSSVDSCFLGSCQFTESKVWFCFFKKSFNVCLGAFYVMTRSFQASISLTLISGRLALFFSTISLN